MLLTRLANYMCSSVSSDRQCRWVSVRVLLADG